MERPYEVDACQLLAVWALVVAATQEAAPVRSAVLLGVASAAAVVVDFLHGGLLGEPLAVLGRLAARLTASPEPVAVAMAMAGFVLELPVQAAGGTARPCSAVAPAQV